MLLGQPRRDYRESDRSQPRSHFCLLSTGCVTGGMLFSKPSFSHLEKSDLSGFGGMASVRQLIEGPSAQCTPSVSYCYHRCLGQAELGHHSWPCLLSGSSSHRSPHLPHPQTPGSCLPPDTDHTSGAHLHTRRLPQGAGRQSPAKVLQIATTKAWHARAKTEPHLGVSSLPHPCGAQIDTGGPAKGPGGPAKRD